MLLSPAVLKHHVAAASRGRYALNSIALRRDGVLSTDGHSLLFVKYPDVDPAEAPKIEGVDPKSPAPAGEPFLLALDDAAKAATLLGKPKRHAPPITQYVQADIRGDTIAFGVTDLATTRGMTARRLEGVFPEVGRVIPDYSNALAFSVNLDQLVQSVKALRGVTNDDVVTIRVIDDQQALGFSCRDGTAMLVMPVQVESPTEHVADQFIALRTGLDAEGPPPTKPTAPPAAPDDDDQEDSTPTETEMHEAQDAYDALPPVPERRDQTPAPVKRRRRRKVVVDAQAELQEIVAGN